MKLILATLLLILLGIGAVRVVLARHPPLRDTTTVYAVGSDTSILLTRLSRSDTGFIAGQLTTRVAYIEQGGAVVEHRAQYGGAQVTETGIAGGSDRLERVDRGWELRVAGGGVQVTAELRGQAETCPPTPASLNGGLGLTPENAVAPGGQVTSSGGMVLRASALVVHSVPRDDAPGPALYVFSPTFSAGVDPLSPCPAWVRAGELEWTGAAPEVGLGMVTLGRWRVTVKPAGPTVLLDGTAHLHRLERVLAGLVGFRPAVQELRRVSVAVEGPGVSGPRTGLLLTTR